MRYHLVARIDTDDPSALQPVVTRIVERQRGVVRSSAHGFEVELDAEGSSARDLNRDLLSELRRAVKKTRLRSEWTNGDTTVMFFDYVPKGVRKG